MSTRLLKFRLLQSKAKKSGANGHDNDLEPFEGLQRAHLADEEDHVKCLPDFPALVRIAQQLINGLVDCVLDGRTFELGYHQWNAVDETYRIQNDVPAVASPITNSNWIMFHRAKLEMR
jgi:hypothetical protein